MPFGELLEARLDLVAEIKVRRAAEVERDRYKVALERLTELVAQAAPLAWVANHDMDGAAAWEKLAAEALAAQPGERG